MIATALKLQQAPRDAVFNDLTIYLAQELIEARNIVDEDKFKEMLLGYSATLSSLTTAFTTEALLTEQQMSDMMEAINELEQIEKDVM